LEPEGSPEEETRIKSASAALFFGGDDGFWRSFGDASSPSFSCESAVCSRVESWRRNWNRSCSPKLFEDSSFEDLQRATGLQQDEITQEEIREQQLMMRQDRSLEELSSPLEGEDDCPEAWREWPHRRHRPRKESGRQALLSPRLDQHLWHSRALPKHATLWAWLMPTLLEP
jgi:hypothetical protein